MPKSHDRPHREAKKPKANKKPAQSASTFLRPTTPPPAPPKPKEPTK